MQDSTHRAQRGFVPQRHFLQNVIDLDSASRTFALQNRGNRKLSQWFSILALFDFLAAFPSMLHHWIFSVLDHRGFPQYFINFVRSLYFCNAAYASVSGGLQFLYWIFSGVLQGCPASAFLFDCALDPFLEAFGEIFDKNTGIPQHPARIGIIRACADDIGMALLSFRALSYIKPVFDCAENLAGLALGQKMCGRHHLRY